MTDLKIYLTMGLSEDQLKGFSENIDANIESASVMWGIHHNTLHSKLSELFIHLLYAGNEQ